MNFSNETILITGGTGSLGKVLLYRLLYYKEFSPKKIIIFSRDEAKQHSIKTDKLYKSQLDKIEFRIGDVRNYSDVCSAIKDSTIIINAAALKQVPSCEYFPEQAILTNCKGPINILRALQEKANKVHTVIGISTDKACKPVNTMGMTKALQEKIFLSGNIQIPSIRFVCVRYGNVLASRGSVIPLFIEQLENNQPLTITNSDMTRFLLSLNDAVDTIFYSLEYALSPGEIIIPHCKSGRVIDIATIFLESRGLPVSSSTIKYIGDRPGEKLHEILISEEELKRTSLRGKYYVIKSHLQESKEDDIIQKDIYQEYSSENNLLTKEEVKQLLQENNLLNINQIRGEILR